MLLSEDVVEFINRQRVARLATVDERGRPHIVPICFVLDNEQVYSVLDAKPKRVDVRELRRVRNVAANPDVQIVFDRWDEDWSKLAYVQLRGLARVIEAGEEQSRAVALLRERYTQYREMAIDDAPVIAVRIEGVVAWGKLAG